MQLSRIGIDRFRQHLSAVFQALGLEIDGREGEMLPEYISVDGFDIGFDLTGDEKGMRVMLTVGALSADRLRRRDQMRRVLRRNLALIRDHRFCAVLEEGEGGRDLLSLQFSQPFQDLRAQSMGDRLGELVAMADEYHELIGGEPDTLGDYLPEAGDDTAETIIFRP